MLKEIKYDKNEGIVPDVGDLDEEIVELIINNRLKKIN